MLKADYSTANHKICVEKLSVWAAKIKKSEFVVRCCCTDVYGTINYSMFNCFINFKLVLLQQYIVMFVALATYEKQSEIFKLNQMSAELQSEQSQ